jgi:DNA-binding beta-propeller fold protein YncE
VRGFRAAVSLGGALALCGCAAEGGRSPWPGSAATHPGHGPGHLSIAKDTAALPLNLLIAERDDTLIAVTPRGQIVWREHQADPGQVFVSRTGRTLVIAEPQADVVVLRRVDNGLVSFFVGRRHDPGSARDRLDDPASASETARGEIAIADRGNCRILLVSPESRRPPRTLGEAGVCTHLSRPLRFSYPAAVLPASGGELVVTESRPARVDIVAGNGRLLRSVAVRGFSAPSDASEFSADAIIVADRTDPGRIEELDARSGAVIWSYAQAAGPGALNDPSLASVLPDGDVLAVDSGNDRVVVIDRRRKAIVWQYGHTAVAGRRPGYLDDPGSATLVPLGGS